MGTEPAHAEGAAVCCFEGDEGEGGTAAAAEKEDQRRGGRGGAAAKRSFAAISYRLPHVSARMVPLLQGFCGEVFGAAGGGGAGEEEKAAVAGGGAAWVEAEREREREREGEPFSSLRRAIEVRKAL